MKIHPMYDFFVGVIFGVIGARVFSKKKVQSVSVQVDQVPIAFTAPIPVSRRTFVPGALSNFWGKDS
jgi:hypothetical protein